MSKIGTFTAGTDISAKLEKPVHAFVFEFMIAKARIPKNALPTSVTDYMEMLRTLDLDATVDIKYQTKDGNVKRAFANIPLLALLELQSANENQIVVSPVFSGETFEGVKLSGYLPLSDSGAIAFNDDEVLQLSVPAITDVAATVYAIDHPRVAATFNEIGVLSVQQNQKERSFDIKNVQTLIVRLSDLTASTELTFFHTNGKTMIYKVEELRNLGLLSNEVAYNFNGLILSGFGLYAMIDCTTINRVDLNRTSSAAFDMYIEKENVLPNFETAEEKNEALYDTTRDEKFKQIQMINRG